MASIQHIRVGFSFGLAAVAIAMAAWWLAPWGLVLLWPMISLLLVAAAYLLDAPGFFGKRAGRLSPSTRLLLLPYLAGQWLWRQKDWRPGTPAAHEVMPGLLFGRLMTRREAQRFVGEGVAAVLDLTCEHDEAAPFRELPGYRNIQVLDLTFPAIEAIEESVRFILERRARGPVLLHCAVGRGRSAIVVVAALMAANPDLDVDAACDRVKSIRSRAKLHGDIRAHIRRYHDRVIRAA